MDLSLIVQFSQILTTLPCTGGIPARVHPEEYDSRHSGRLRPGWRGPHADIFPNWVVIGSS
jgi:hypothetical protein